MQPLWNDTAGVQKDYDTKSDAGADVTERRFVRWGACLLGSLEVNTQPIACMISDLSPGGARVSLRGALHLSIGDMVSMYLPAYRGVEAEVRYADDAILGLAFHQSETDELAMAQHLLSLKNQGVLYDRRDKHPHSDDTPTGWLKGTGGRARGLLRHMQAGNGESAHEEVSASYSQGVSAAMGIDFEALEARARSACEALAERTERERELWRVSLEQEAEVDELQQRSELLSDEAQRLLGEARLTANECERLRHENEELRAREKQAQDDIDPLRDELERITRDREAIGNMLDTLVTQIELNANDSQEKTIQTQPAEY